MWSSEEDIRSAEATVSWEPVDVGARIWKLLWSSVGAVTLTLLLRLLAEALPTVFISG